MKKDDVKAGGKKADESPQWKSYRVVTDRNPFWDGVPLPQNAVFRAFPSHPALAAMLERVWIVEV